LLLHLLLFFASTTKNLVILTLSKAEGEGPLYWHLLLHLLFFLSFPQGIRFPVHQIPRQHFTLHPI